MQTCGPPDGGPLPGLVASRIETYGGRHRASPQSPVVSLLPRGGVVLVSPRCALSVTWVRLYRGCPMPCSLAGLLSHPVPCSSFLDQPPKHATPRFQAAGAGVTAGTVTEQMLSSRSPGMHGTTAGSPNSRGYTCPPPTSIKEEPQGSPALPPCDSGQWKTKGSG